MLRSSTVICSRCIRSFSISAICLSKNPWLKLRSLDQLKQALPSVPTPVLEVVHSCSEELPLNEMQRSTIKDYVSKEGIRISSANRSILMKYLYGKKEYDIIELLAKTHLFEENGNFLENASVSNVRVYFEVLINTNQLTKLEEEAIKFLSQFSINKQGTSVYMINFLLVRLYQNHKPESALYIWMKLVKTYYGHCELTSMEVYGPVLSQLYYFFKFSKKSHECIIPLLRRVQHEDGTTAASQLASTLITFFGSSRWFKEAERVWQWKLDRELPIIASDLTNIMRSKCHFRKWDEVLKLHDSYSLAQDDFQQFDYLLIALAKKQNWDQLKNQFDSLFGIGELPTVNHYGVIMYALSMHGEVDLVEKLYGQLLRRGMTPSYAVILSLANAHFQSGDYNGALNQISQFKRYDIHPTSASYLLLLKIYKMLGSLDSCFKVIKTMGSENIPLHESHFHVIIQLCSKLKNYAVAEELFNIMRTDYYIQPTGLTISTLNRIFLESKLYKKSSQLLLKYEQVLTEDVHKIVQGKILYYTQTGKLNKAEAEIKLYFKKGFRTDGNFYMALLQYLVNGRQDYESAEKVLTELMKTNVKLTKPDHINILLEEYNRIGYLEGVSALISKSIDAQIPMNSKTLYFLVKSRFELTEKRREPYEYLIGWLEEVLESIAAKKLNFTTSTVHPSVITWPMNRISKNDDASKAIELFTKYVDLFYPNSKAWSEKLTIIRALLIVSAESGRWEEFDTLFKRYSDRLELYQKQPSAVVRNTYLRSAFNGLLQYKLERMSQQKELDKLPALIMELEESGFTLTNKEWNDILWALIKRKNTFDFSMKKLNDVFIHGYTWIHRARTLRKRDRNGPSSINHMTSASPSQKNTSNLYLKSELFEQIMIQIDKHLRKHQLRLEEELKRLMCDYPYVMKQYLRKPRNNINGWDLIEKRHSTYFQKVRNTYELIPIEEF